MRSVRWWYVLPILLLVGTTGCIPTGESPEEKFEEITRAVLRVVDVACVAGIATIYIENVGTQTLPAAQQSCTQTLGTCSGQCIPVDLEPNVIRIITITDCSSGTNSWRISWPTGSITATGYCS